MLERLTAAHFAVWATAALSLAIANSSAMADPNLCWLKENACRAYIGKRLWVSIPSTNQNVVEVTFNKGNWDNTLKLKSGSSFVVTGYEPEDSGAGGDYAVKLDDGRRGWVGASGPFLLDFDPVARAKSAAEECARRGQPKIGMTPEELTASCWGKPRRIVKKTTVAGVEENYIYTIGHIVKFTDGKVSEIIEAR